MISVYQVVVDRFRFTDHTDRTSDGCCIAGKLTDSIHGIVTADIEEPADIQFFKFTEQFRVDRIFQRFREFIATGAKIGTRSVSKPFKLIARKCLAEIKKAVIQESFNTVYHTIYVFDLVRMSETFRNNSVEAAVDYGSRSAGLSDDKIFL